MAHKRQSGKLLDANLPTCCKKRPERLPRPWLKSHNDMNANMQFATQKQITCTETLRRPWNNASNSPGHRAKPSKFEDWFLLACLVKDLTHATQPVQKYKLTASHTLPPQTTKRLHCNVCLQTTQIFASIDWRQKAAPGKKHDSGKHVFGWKSSICARQYLSVSHQARGSRATMLRMQECNLQNKITCTETRQRN